MPKRVKTQITQRAEIPKKIPRKKAKCFVLLLCLLLLLCVLFLLLVIFLDRIASVCCKLTIIGY